MESYDIFTPIKESFELWYNASVSKSNPVSVAINYSDTQTLSVKAYHKAQVEMCLISAIDGKSTITPFISLEENYNHGITTEQEAKENMAKKLLTNIYCHIKFL